MRKKYDVVIVGAGPGGAMAAKVAGENGLKTLLIERKNNPAEITRGCTMMFAVENSYYFAERMHFNEKNNKMLFPVNGFTVDYDGPRSLYYAWHFYSPDGKSRLAFGDYEESRKKGEKGRLSFTFDKGWLINGLIQEAKKNDVDVRTGMNMNGIVKTEKGVEVSANGETFEAPFVIGADGISSRVAQLMGFNDDRKYFGTHPALTYYVTGIDIPQPEAITTAICFKPGEQHPTPFWLVPSPYAKGEYWMHTLNREALDYITKDSIYAKWFPKFKINRTWPYVGSLWSPVSEPYKDNVLLVGDAAWFGEAEITGSMMCGWKAANAITVAMIDNNLNREGVVDYINWWKRSYPDFDDWRNFFMIGPFMALMSETEMNYVFRLLKDPLPPNNNPFLTVRMVKKALEPLMPQIQKEMPAIVEKIGMLEIENVEKIASVLLEKEAIQA